MRNKKGQFIDGSHGISTRFTSERLKGNQSAKGNPKNATTFGVVDTAMEKHPQWKGGLYRARDCTMITYESKKRMPYARYKWIQVYGEIPKKHVIIHKDGDKFNDELENLDCISMAENIRRNNKRWK
jgi:hypothetical protein